MQIGLTGALRSAADGASEIEIEADTIRELMQELIKRYPKMADHMDEGIAVAIDGQIFRDEWSQKIPPGAEVFLMPRLQGG
ncbi:MAG: MoaD/ThiS family protein [Proteobacteria bacterium]|jgi:molybdopterin synthase sulfur carrier subunit|nr:MoaD/ThiS family protein [Pseudomonadota bacterium]MDA1300868.1 MoaD/ThiS family protein [Pseudomonadota bacterium]